MEIQHLVVMANQIGDFFKSYPNQHEAKKEIANHIKRFWASSMRMQLIAYIEEQNAPTLDVIVREAVQENRAYLV